MQALLPRRIAFVTEAQPEDVKEEDLQLPPLEDYLYPKDAAYRLLTTKQRARRVGAGLQNGGNTCYLNSVLQVLTYTPPFASYLVSDEHVRSCLHRGGNNWCLICAMRAHVLEVMSTRGNRVHPRHILQRLRFISKDLRVGRQEDAHEFLRQILDACHRSFIPAAASKQDDKISPAISHTTLVHQLFGGYLRSQVKCQDCKFSSNTYDPFLDLSLEIDRASSLESALERFTTEETLTESNKYKCQKCKKPVRAQKRFLVHRAPKILTIQLKRFDYGVHGQKINKAISFKEELELKPYTSGDQKKTYRLYAVVVHAGNTMKSGHYFSFARNIGSDLWYRFDDEHVSQVGLETVLRCQAYLLFYELKSSCVSPTRSPIKAKAIDPFSLERVATVPTPAPEIGPEPVAVPTVPTPTATPPSSSPSSSSKAEGSELLTAKLEKIKTLTTNPLPQYDSPEESSSESNSRAPSRKSNRSTCSRTARSGYHALCHLRKRSASASPASKRRKLDGQGLRKDEASERRNQARSFKTQFGTAQVDTWDDSANTDVSAQREMVPRIGEMRDKHDQEYDEGKTKHKPRKKNFEIRPDAFNELARAKIEA